MSKVLKLVSSLTRVVKIANSLSETFAKNESEDQAQRPLMEEEGSQNEAEKERNSQGEEERKAAPRTELAGVLFTWNANHFSSFSSSPRSVLLASSVNNWQPMPMEKIVRSAEVEDGESHEKLEKWEITLLLPIGSEVQFKFVVDGQWVVDDQLPTVGEGIFVNNLLHIDPVQ